MEGAGIGLERYDSNKSCLPIGLDRYDSRRTRTSSQDTAQPALDPWAGLEVSLAESDDEDQQRTCERTPLQSPERRSDGMDPSAAGASADAMTQDAAERARQNFEALRQSRTVQVLLGLFVADPLIDLLLLIIHEDDTASEIDSEIARTWARTGRVIAQIFTLLLSLYCYGVLHRWQRAEPRNRAATAAQFALLPEYKVICFVLDVGKLAYPSGLRVFLVIVSMLARLVSVVLLIRVAYAAGLRRGLLGSTDLPDMLRTLISLEGADKQGLGA
eukprot:5241231-Prymnesium_polylepis.1